MQKISASIKRENFFFIGLFLLAFIVRSFIFVTLLQKNNNYWVYPDSVQYYTTAQQIAAGNGITNDQGDSQFYRLPGYSLFLAVGMQFYGNAIDVVLWLQLLLSCIVPILMFLLAQTLFPGAALIAKIAALVAAVHVGFLLYAGMIMTEALFLIVLLLFFILFYRSAFLLSGFVLGVASLIRPVGLYVIAVALFVLFLQRTSLRLWIKQGCFLVGGWSIVIVPWLIRNFLLTGALFFHTLPGHHFLQYSAAYVLMERDHCSYGDVRPGLLAQWDNAVNEAEKISGKRLNDYQRCCVAESIAGDIIKKYPWYACKTGLIQIAKTCIGLYTAQPLLSDAYAWPHYDKDTSLMIKIKRFLCPDVRHKILIPIIYFEILYLLLLAIGLLFFVVHAFVKKDSLRLLRNAGLFIVMFIGITLGYGCARLRMPVEPFLIIFASAGWIWTLQRLFKKNETF